MRRLTLLALALLFYEASTVSAQSPLRSAQNFAVLATTTVTNTGVTIVTGDLGVSPGTAITGFPPGIVLEGTTHKADMVAAQAQADAHLAYAGLKAMACLPINNLSGRILGTDVLSLPPGVYCFNSSAQLTGTLFLTGAGPWVFQVGSTLKTASNSHIVVVGAALNCGSNVFWQVGSSATIGAGTEFVGNVLAAQSIALTTAASVSGSALALVGAVTMDRNNVSVCRPGFGSVPRDMAGRGDLKNEDGDHRDGDNDRNRGKDRDKVKGKDQDQDKEEDRDRDKGKDRDRDKGRDRDRDKGKDQDHDTGDRDQDRGDGDRDRGEGHSGGQPPPPPTATVCGTGPVNYVRAGATGANNGTDWMNAYTAFPVTLNRGTTYCVAGGNYSARMFNDANSGTTLITIRGATVADHGTSTGWQNSYSVETAQAHFGGTLTFDSSYWTFDGAVGSGSTSSAYGFTIDKPAGCVGQADIRIGNTDNTSISNLTFSHIAFMACAEDVDKVAVSQYTLSNSWNDSTISHNLFDGYANAVRFEGLGPTNSNQTFEYNYMQHAFSSLTHHGEQIDVDGNSVTNLVVRFNDFADCAGTACVAANNSPILGGAFYGNVAGNANTGNGIFGAGSDSYMQNVLVYNNTFYSSPASPWWFGGCVSGTSACSNATGNVAENNLIWNMPGTLGGGVGTDDYNAYFQSSDIPPETHGQTGATDPFVNSTGGNFHLAGPTNAGLTLPPPYNVDPDGKTRGSDGTWDRGAYEYP